MWYAVSATGLYDIPKYIAKSQIRYSMRWNIYVFWNVADVRQNNFLNADKFHGDLLIKGANFLPSMLRYMISSNDTQFLIVNWSLVLLYIGM